ncbi:MAG: DUF2946 family protein [Gammaproteobacteria bacterium]|nr:DUF2946 family protein [Gammaproteobacteria bacterium]
MLLRRFFLLLFALTQFSVVAAAPVMGAFADAPATEHCASEGEGAEPSADSGSTHAECDDGCQLCAACAPGVATPMSADPVVPAAEAALFLPAPASVGVPTTLLRPPAIS